MTNQNATSTSGFSLRTIGFVALLLGSFAFIVFIHAPDFDSDLKATDTPAKRERAQFAPLPSSGRPISAASQRNPGIARPPAKVGVAPSPAFALSRMPISLSESTDDNLRTAERLNTLLRESDPQSKELSLLALRRWANHSPEAAASWWENLQLAQAPAAAADKADPAEADTDNTATTRADLGEQLILGWLETDRAGALRWLSGLKSDPKGSDAASSKDELIIVAGYELARDEPIAALDLTAALPPSDARNDLLVHALRQWADRDAAGARQWAGQVPDAELRDRLIAATALSLAKHERK